MGAVVKFPRRGHARASVDSAKASNVICAQPLSAASLTRSGQRRGGIPRFRQPLTTEAGRPNPVDTAPVPPKSSIAESGVIDINIVRNLRTSQGFASGETTFHVPCGPILAMVDSPEVIGPRLKRLRKALGFKTQVAFAKKLGIEKNTYNPFEKGTRTLTFEVACTLRRLYGVPLDYMFYGADADRLPAHIYAKLDQVG